MSALSEGAIGAAGLDVMTPEPLPTDHPLINTPNISKFTPPPLPPLPEFRSCIDIFTSFLGQTYLKALNEAASLKDFLLNIFKMVSKAIMGIRGNPH